MRPISINLATRPFYNTTLYQVAFAVSLGLLLLMTGLNAYAYFVDQRAWSRFLAAEARLREEVRSLESRQQGYDREIRKLNLRQMLERSEFASTAIVSWKLSWTLLFNRLEEVLPIHVRLLSIRPRIGDGTIHFRVQGIAKNPMAFTEFEENLLASPLFSDVYPLSERSDPSAPGTIQFNLVFRYLPDEQPAPEETGDDAGPAGEEVPPADTTQAAVDPAPSGGSS